MKDSVKVAIGFSVFIVLGCGILGFGLWRRGLVDEDRDTLADKAKALAQITATEFARESGAEQTKILRDAADTLEAAKKQKQFPQDVLDDLSAWIRVREKLREAIPKKKARLKELTAALEHAFPKEAEKQLPPSVVQRLREAVKAARGPDSELAVTVGRRPVDITHACRDEADGLACRADEAERELNKRERLFKAFVLKAQRADKNAQTKRAYEVRKEIERTWGQCTQADPEKKRVVDALYARVANLADRPKRQNAARDRLVKSIQQVAKVPNRAELHKVRPAFEAAVKRAREYEALKPVEARARRVLAATEERTLPKPTPSPQDQQREHRWRLTLEIGKKVGAITKLQWSVNRSACEEKWRQVGADLSQLAKTDRLYAQALTGLLTAWRRKVDKPPPPAAQRRFLAPPWDQFKAGFTTLARAVQVLDKIRDLVKSAPVRLVKSAPVRKGIIRGTKWEPDPVAAKMKEDALAQLDKWLQLLRDQRDDVLAASTQRRP